VIAVVGAGGVGGLLAALLSRAGEDVLVVAPEETAARIAGQGIHVVSDTLGEFTARPCASSRLDRQAQLMLMTVKAPDLDAALARIDAAPALTVPLLNGFEHFAPLRERLPKVLTATIRVQSERTAPGEIRHTSPFLRVDVAPPGREADAVAVALGPVGVEVVVSESEPDVIWGKLSRLAALALTTAAFGQPIGPIRSTPELAGELWAVVDEVAAVASAEGAATDAGTVRKEIEALPPGATSSLARDVAAGREGELDALAGAVARAGARHGIPTPAVERLALAVRGRIG
jgi:2-dehydropantoate 2-reductase